MVIDLVGRNDSRKTKDKTEASANIKLFNRSLVLAVDVHRRVQVEGHVVVVDTVAYHATEVISTAANGRP